MHRPRIIDRIADYERCQGRTGYRGLYYGDESFEGLAATSGTSPIKRIASRAARAHLYFCYPSCSVANGDSKADSMPSSYMEKIVSDRRVSILSALNEICRSYR
jgi:hypothetical protein